MSTDDLFFDMLTAPLQVGVQTTTAAPTPEPVVLAREAPCVKNARKTHCKSGHLLSGANLRIRTGGGRECKECRRITRIEKREVTNAAARINYARRQEQGKQR